MPLSPGTQLGPYRITAPLGAGGMGEVYRARDTRLNRDVAIKTLPANFANDPSRMARFEREAQLLAALNHPNIAAIYGLESGALVMELVEGATLAERIKQGSIPLDEALAIARQISDALEAAHEKNIIHRDLKPANVKITPEGHVKVLDFGLAKAFEPETASAAGNDLTNSPTLTLEATRAGVILGTAGYMSPEQARGRPVDKRADIWSFGVVLYEMLTGRRTFEGDTVSDTLASILKTDPDWSRLPADTPPNVRRLLRLCLQRDPKCRLRDIGDARLEIDAPGEPAPAPQARTVFRWMPWAALSLLLSGAAVWGWLRTPPAAPRRVIRFSVPLSGSPTLNPIAISRDGTRVAFALGAGTPIYVRALEEMESRPIPGTEDGLFPSFSPDGQWIAYLSGSPAQLKKAPVAGGAPLTLADGLNANPIAWGADDHILGTIATRIVRVAASGGKPESLAAADLKMGELAYVAPQLLPGGSILFAILTRTVPDVRVATFNPQTGEKKILLDGAGVAFYAATGSRTGSGHLVYGRNGALFALPFDVEGLKVGSASPVLEGIMRAGIIHPMGISGTGTLAYFAGGAAEVLANPSTLVWADRQGAVQPVAAPPNVYSGIPRVSPDGGRIAAEIFDYQRMSSDIWTYDVARGTLTRLTFERNNQSPVWSADGKRVIFRVADALTPGGWEVRSVPVDGSGPAVTIVPADGTRYVPNSVSADGKLLMGVRNPAAETLFGFVGGSMGVPGNEIWALSLAGDSASGVKPKPQAFLRSEFTKASPVFSADGKWVAYSSNESGLDEVYVVPYPGPGGKSLISSGGGNTPRWAANGRELFYRNGAGLMAVDVETGASFHAGTRRRLFDKPGNYDVSPDGKRFLMTRPAGSPQGRPAEIRVVVNWFEELRRRAR